MADHKRREEKKSDSVDKYSIRSIYRDFHFTQWSQVLQEVDQTWELADRFIGNSTYKLKIKDIYDEIVQRLSDYEKSIGGLRGGSLKDAIDGNLLDLLSKFFDLTIPAGSSVEKYLEDGDETDYSMGFIMVPSH